VRALIVESPGSVRMAEVPVPDPGEDEVLIRVRCVGICGSDFNVYLGTHPFASYPRIPGHEVSGDVVESRSGRFRAGDRVCVEPYFNCGSCYPCRRGRRNCCENNRTMGVQRDGAMCEYIAVPAEKIFRSERGLSYEELALVEPISIGAHAVRRSGLRPGERALVIGVGPIGLGVLQVAKLKGAQVMASDMNRRRLELAGLLGADHVVDPGEVDLARSVAEFTGGDGMDVVFEASGSPSGFLSAINSAAFGGRVVLVGTGTEEVTFSHPLIVKKELDVLGSRNSMDDFPEVIGWMEGGRIDPRSIITDRYPFEEADRALRLVDIPERNFVKIMIDFR